MRIDPGTANEVHLILAKCRTRGTDPVQALDARGLLRYPQRRLEDQRRVVTFIIETLESMTPTQIGNGRVPATAMDMKQAILDKLSKWNGSEREAT
jgi:hypothetical protein